MQTQTATTTRRAALKKPQRKPAAVQPPVKADEQTRRFIEAVKGLKGLKLVR